MADHDLADDQNMLLPISQSPSPPQQNNLISQKSLSFSNLLDATDFSMLSSFLSDNYPNPPGFESSPSATPVDINSNYDIINLDSPSIHTNGNYLVQRTPQLNTSSVMNMGNNYNYKNKRQISGIEEDAALYPSKRYMTSSCSFPNNNNTTSHHQLDKPQWNFLPKQSLFNQQLLLGPHLRFQGWFQTLLTRIKKKKKRESTFRRR